MLLLGEKSAGGVRRSHGKGDRSHMKSQGNCERGERRRMSILRRVIPKVTITPRERPVGVLCGHPCSYRGSSRASCAVKISAARSSVDGLPVTMPFPSPSPGCLLDPIHCDQLDLSLALLTSA